MTFSGGLTMLRITITEKPDAVVLRAEGKLAGPELGELEKSWKSASQKQCILDLRGVTFISPDGQSLLERMCRAGVKMRAEGMLTQAIVRRLARHMLIILAVLLAGRTALGQETIKLTMQEAVRMALKQNPQVTVAGLNTSQSEQDRAVSRSALLPQIGLDATDGVHRLNLEAAIGAKFPGAPQHTGPFWAIQAGPGYSMPLFDLSLWRRYQASREGVQVAGAQEMGVREQTVLLVVSQYLGCLRAAADVSAAESRVTLAQALYNQAADLQKTGVGTSIDTLRANVELQNETQRLIVARTHRDTSLYALARLLNIDPQAKTDLTDQVSFFSTPSYEAGQTLEQAYNARPEMKEMISRLRQARFQRQAAGAARWPKLATDGGWTLQGLTPNSMIPVYQFEATFQLPLFTGGRIAAEQTRADLEIHKLEQQETDLKNRIALEVKTALAQLESARHEVDVANLGVKLAQQEIEQARDRFSAGVANNIEVITAQDGLSRANDNQISALYRYNQARADLSHAVGQMELLYAH
jgi:outer membrane protein